MRDESIIGGLNKNANNTARLYQALVEIDARRVAFELVAGKRWSLLEAILSPRSFWSKVDAATVSILATHQKNAKKMAEEIEKERKKPKLLKP